MEEVVKELFKTIEYLRSEARRVSGVEPDLRDLGDTVERIRARLRDAEQRRLIEDHSVLKWLRDLKDLVFDYEDIDEEFKARVALSKSRASRKRKRSWFHFSFSAPLPYHYWAISKKIAGIRKRYEKIYRDRTHLRLEEWEARPAVATRTLPALMAGSIQDRTRIHGRQNDVERIVRLLTVAGRDGLPVICIHGAGGLGKSALARSILQDSGVEAYFAQRIWINVSVGSDVMGITKDIIQSVTGRECDHSTSLDLLQRHLGQLLDGKTFLVVLDGVKDLDIQSWEALRAPLVTARKEAIKVGETGGSEVRTKASKVLVTTQNQNVSRNMKAEQVTLEGLPDEDCWLVFRDHAFGGPAAASGLLEVIGKAIARKCRGSPLAAKLVGSHLYNVGASNEFEWMDVLSKMPDLGDAVSIILPTLKLSYDHLPFHLKHCFAFCSLFPNGHEFDKDELVKLWMAVGFVQPTRGKTVENIAAKYFDDLVWRSFFQASHNLQQRDKRKYRIPGVIHEVAQSVSKFECLRVDHDGVRHEEAKRPRYALVCQRFMESVALEKIYENQGLRTFILHGEDGPRVRHMYILSKLFQSLRYLRVLDLSHGQLEELPDSLGDLILLRYLNLYSTQIKSLPESVGNLYNLQTLELGNCRYFHVLPDSIGDLEHLRYLGLYSTQLIKLPESVGKLSNLQKLELGGCQQLLELPDSVGNLRQLRYLGLSGTRIERLPESLRSLSKLETLDLGDCSELIELPDWLGNSSFSNLETLCLSKCKCSSLPCLGRLPRLKNLHIEGLHAVTEMGPVVLDNHDERGGFPVLQKLSLLDMPNLEKWFEMKDSDMARLSELIISGCSSLGIVSHLPLSLEKLEIRNCPKFICTSAPLSFRNLVVEGCPIFQSSRIFSQMTFQA